MPKKIADNPYLDDNLGITDDGHKFLADWVTDSRGPAYAFLPGASPTVVATAMARLSRRDSGIRECILDEFVLDEEGAEAVQKRVVTEFGDDSVQQTMFIQGAVEMASNLLTKALERGRLMAYLEQSTRYIPFDEKTGGRYRYYTPETLPDRLDREYTNAMDQLFNNYSAMFQAALAHLRATVPRPDKDSDRIGWAAWPGALRGQACDAARHVLPAAVQSTVGITGSAQAWDNLIMFLLSSDLREFRDTGHNLLAQVRQVAPGFFERTDQPDRGQLAIDYRHDTRSKMRELAAEYLDQSEARSRASGQIFLEDYWPRTELNLVPEMLYASSNLSLDEIERQVNQWSIVRKVEVYLAYMGERLNRRHRPDRALEKAHFEWDIDGRDYGSFRDLQRHRMVDAFEWQWLTPYNGHIDPPELIVEVGMEDTFYANFDISRRLYEAMVEANCIEEAQYATLLGHNMRYRFITNLREAFHLIELRSQVGGHPAYRKIANKMYEHIARVYPLAAEAMKFVNRADNLDELTRMASERASAAKRQKLGLAE